VVKRSDVTRQIPASDTLRLRPSVSSRTRESGKMRVS